jgi:hypothetical protein
MEFAAAVAAVAAYYAQIDPARPFQTLPLVGVLPPAQADQFTLAERNLISTTASARRGRRRRRRSDRAADHDLRDAPRARMTSRTCDADDDVHADVSAVLVARQSHREQVSRVTSWRTTARGSALVRPS